MQYFKIEGLHGYRSISLESDYAATLLIAKNGSGKTTLLAALDAFLKGQFSRLKELQFSSIRCKLRSLSDELVLTSEEVSKYTSNAVVEAESRRLEIETSMLYLHLEEHDSDTDRVYLDDEVTSTLMQKHGHSYANVRALCDRLTKVLHSEVPTILSTLKLLRSAMENVEVVYLPTYRRIELAIPARPDRYGRMRKQVLPAQRSGLYSGDIQFGLSDVVDRLSDLNQRIVTDSSLGYRELSASIINELISGQFDRADPMQDEIPDRAELELFFSRLKDDRTRRHYGPHFELSIPNIAQIYTGTGGISQESNKFLRYFLGKLNSVVQSTREIEALVRDFIDNCNKYMSSVDISTTMHGRDLLGSPASGEIDGKVLTLSRRDLTISVDSLEAHRKIPLNSLSSGEKQMISLFAKLYLYPKEKIILIDEPELSLSLDWQRQILVDIVEAPLCRQVVAITHSPFVFDNSLEPFARPLTSAVDAERASQVAEDFEPDNT
ncbi:AAA family ATPase [Bradyrhizobium sp. 41S5]|uniref:AAA family ATPase n=1 Tax=Bradyrhizobium sp. 41S5 TaxID=1404443 RepID=UPI00156ABD76|nr:AAA family ATPase [Bradyrhizobium sp. 41S5]UFX42101.1 AAA family ATPase [Bradyrhizobium sp. 41S5]